MKIGLIDLNTGNMGSLVSAMKKLNVDVKICKSKEDMVGIKKLILPGVGAFKDFMKKIKTKNVDKEIKKLSMENVSILGVCLGFQILFDQSMEHGFTQGLSMVTGKVDSLTTINKKLKIPHVGWNSCKYDKKNPLFDGISDYSDFYFTHSYCVKEHDKKIRIAITEYDGSNFTSAIASKNVYGVQFHPEKSQFNGLRLLKNFSELSQC